MTDKNFLFSKYDWFSVDQHQRAQLQEEVANLEGNRLLNTSIDDLCAYFVEKYRADIPILKRGEIEVDQREIQIDVSRDPMRAIYDRSQPVYVTGTEIEVIVPFIGDAEAFKVRPTIYSFNPPRGIIKDEVLILSISGVDLDADQVSQEIESRLDRIDSHLTSLRGSGDRLNNELDSIARQAIEQRRKKLLADQNLVASLGFKLKPRGNSPKTYTAPEVRRKITPKLPSASSVPYKPEPTLDEPDYDHILEVIENMAQVMERSPSAFSTMDEESLRSHFLVQLNGHYEGQATGETFNYEGKTDILIRSEGKNIFIAECKYWGGPNTLTAAIDQLLNYSSWRDTKVAVIVFNKNKNFTNVLNSIKSTTKKHPNYKCELDQRSEPSFRFIFSHRDDPNREMKLTIMAFNVPK